jgi:hypothetical protein
MTDVLNAEGFGSGTGAKPAGKLGQSLNRELSREMVAGRSKGGVMVVDHNFRVVMIDAKAAQYCSVSAGQSQGKRFYALFPSLLGSFASELHEVLAFVGRKQCSRPAENALLQQFPRAFEKPDERESDQPPTLNAISMRAYPDGNSIYALIQLQWGTDAPLSQQQDGSNLIAEQQGLYGRPLNFDRNAILVVVDSEGFIQSISTAAE